MSKFPLLIPHIASVAEHYLTLHRVHPKLTYNYIARGIRGEPVIECTRHLAKCAIGESWIYFAVSSGSNLCRLENQDKLYVGAQTQDRMFRGDGLSGDNFHHAEMRAGNGTDRLIAFLKTEGQVSVYRVSAIRICEIILSNTDLVSLRPLLTQPLTKQRHRAWWFEHYVLFREPKVWRWNTDPAARVIEQVLGQCV